MIARGYSSRCLGRGKPQSFAFPRLELDDRAFGSRSGSSDLSGLELWGLGYGFSNVGVGLCCSIPLEGPQGILPPLPPVGNDSDTRVNPRPSKTKHMFRVPQVVVLVCVAWRKGFFSFKGLAKRFF